MIRSFRRWLTYPPAERLRFAAAAAALVLGEMAVKIVPARAFLKPLTSTRPEISAESGVWIKWSERVEKVEHHLWRPSCVRRALALTVIAFCTGKRPKLMIGVARSGPFAAHAWLEIGDEVLEFPERLAGYDTLTNGTARV